MISKKLIFWMFVLFLTFLGFSNFVSAEMSITSCNYTDSGGNQAYNDTFCQENNYLFCDSSTNSCSNVCGDDYSSVDNYFHYLNHTLCNINDYAYCDIKTGNCSSVKVSNVCGTQDYSLLNSTTNFIQGAFNFTGIPVCNKSYYTCNKLEKQTQNYLLSPLILEGITIDDGTTYESFNPDYVSLSNFTCEDCGSDHDCDDNQFCNSTGNCDILDCNEGIILFHQCSNLTDSCFGDNFEKSYQYNIVGQILGTTINKYDNYDNCNGFTLPFGGNLLDFKKPDSNDFSQLIISNNINIVYGHFAKYDDKDRKDLKYERWGIAPKFNNDGDVDSYNFYIDSRRRNVIKTGLNWIATAVTGVVLSVFSTLGEIMIGTVFAINEGWGAYGHVYSAFGDMMKDGIFEGSSFVENDFENFLTQLHNATNQSSSKLFDFFIGENISNSNVYVSLKNRYDSDLLNFENMLYPKIYYSLFPKYSVFSFFLNLHEDFSLFDFSDKSHAWKAANYQTKGFLAFNLESVFSNYYEYENKSNHLNREYKDIFDIEEAYIDFGRVKINTQVEDNKNLNKLKIKLYVSSFEDGITLENKYNNLNADISEGILSQSKFKDFFSLTELNEYIIEFNKEDDYYDFNNNIDTDDNWPGKYEYTGNLKLYLHKRDNTILMDQLISGGPLHFFIEMELNDSIVKMGVIQDGFVRFRFKETKVYPNFYLKMKIKKERGDFCYDGIDNDNDGYEDWYDTDCLEFAESKNYDDVFFLDWCNENNWNPKPCEIFCKGGDYQGKTFTGLGYDYLTYNVSDDKYNNKSFELSCGTDYPSDEYGTCGYDLVDMTQNMYINQGFSFCCGANGAKDTGTIFSTNNDDGSDLKLFKNYCSFDETKCISDSCKEDYEFSKESLVVFTHDQTFEIKRDNVLSNNFKLEKAQSSYFDGTGYREINFETIPFSTGSVFQYWTSCVPTEELSYVYPIKHLGQNPFITNGPYVSANNNVINFINLTNSGTLISKYDSFDPFPRVNEVQPSDINVPGSSPESLFLGSDNDNSYGFESFDILVDYETLNYCDQDKDGYYKFDPDFPECNVGLIDCNDSNPLIYPGAKTYNDKEGSDTNWNCSCMLGNPYDLDITTINGAFNETCLNSLDFDDSESSNQIILSSLSTDFSKRFLCNYDLFNFHFGPGTFFGECAGYDIKNRYREDYINSFYYGDSINRFFPYVTDTITEKSFLYFDATKSGSIYFRFPIWTETFGLSESYDETLFSYDKIQFRYNPISYGWDGTEFAQSYVDCEGNFTCEVYETLSNDCKKYYGGVNSYGEKCNDIKLSYDSVFNNAYGIPLTSIWRTVNINIIDELKDNVNLYEYKFIGFLLKISFLEKRNNELLINDDADLVTKPLFGSFEFENKNANEVKYCGVINNSNTYINSWIDDLDQNQIACENNFGMIWTGTRCCGDDGSETYNDTDAGCFHGIPVSENTLFSIIRFNYSFNGNDYTTQVPYFNDLHRPVYSYGPQTIVPCEYNLSSNSTKQKAQNCYFLNSKNVSISYYDEGDTKYYYLNALNPQNPEQQIFSLVGNNVFINNTKKGSVVVKNTDFVDSNNSVLVNHLAFYNNSYMLCNAPSYIINIFNGLNVNYYSVNTSNINHNDQVYMNGSLFCTSFGWQKEGVSDIDNVKNAKKYYFNSQDRLKYKKINESILNNRSLNKTITDLGYPKSWLSKFRMSACPENWCWDGTQCIENQDDEFFEVPVFANGTYYTDSYEGDVGYRCSAGEWEEVYRKRTLTMPSKEVWVSKGDFYEPSITESTCIIKSDNQSNQYYDYFDNSFPVANDSLTCKIDEDRSWSSVDCDSGSMVSLLPSGYFIGNYYCNNGSWESRIGKAANFLLNFTFDNDASLVCGNEEDFENIVNNLNYNEKFGGNLEIGIGIDGFCYLNRNNRSILVLLPKLSIGKMRNESINSSFSNLLNKMSVSYSSLSFDKINNKKIEKFKDNELDLYFRLDYDLGMIGIYSFNNSEPEFHDFLKRINSTYLYNNVHYDWSNINFISKLRINSNMILTYSSYSEVHHKDSIVYHTFMKKNENVETFFENQFLTSTVLYENPHNLIQGYGTKFYYSYPKTNENSFHNDIINIYRSLSKNLLFFDNYYDLDFNINLTSINISFPRNNFMKIGETLNITFYGNEKFIVDELNDRVNNPFCIFNDKSIASNVNNSGANTVISYTLEEGDRLWNNSNFMFRCKFSDFDYNYDYTNNFTNFNEYVNVLGDSNYPITVSDINSDIWLTNSSTQDNTNKVSLSNPIKIELTATDAYSGVNKTYYCVDFNLSDNGSCVPNIIYFDDEKINITMDGIYHVRYYSTDIAGNNETNANSNQGYHDDIIKIDTYVPEINSVERLNVLNQHMTNFTINLTFNEPMNYSYNPSFEFYNNTTPIYNLGCNWSLESNYTFVSCKFNITDLNESNNINYVINGAKDLNLSDMIEYNSSSRGTNFIIDTQEILINNITLNKSTTSSVLKVGDYVKLIFNLTDYNKWDGTEDQSLLILPDKVNDVSLSELNRLSLGEWSRTYFVNEGEGIINDGLVSVSFRINDSSGNLGNYYETNFTIDSVSPIIRKNATLLFSNDANDDGIISIDDEIKLIEGEIEEPTDDNRWEFNLSKLNGDWKNLTQGSYRLGESKDGFKQINGELLEFDSILYDNANNTDIELINQTNSTAWGTKLFYFDNVRPVINGVYLYNQYLGSDETQYSSDSLVNISVSFKELSSYSEETQMGTLNCSWEYVDKSDCGSNCEGDFADSVPIFIENGEEYLQEGWTLGESTFGEVNGKINITCDLVDIAKNWAHPKSNVTQLDTTAPFISEFYPKQNELFNYASLTIWVVLNDSYSGIDKELSKINLSLEDSSGPLFDNSLNYYVGDVTFNGNNLSINLTYLDSELSDGEINVNLTYFDKVGHENSTSWTFVIDKTPPTFAISKGVYSGPVQTDTINIDVNDLNTVSGLKYGISGDDTCDSDDIYENTFTDATDFHIAGDHKDYLCVKAKDLAGNVGYQLVGQLNTDNTAPSGYSVSIDQEYVNDANKAAVSFIFDDAEVGTTYDYSIDDTNGDTTAVTGTGTISTGTDQITGIDVSSLNDGTLTLVVTLTDVAGNVGSNSEDEIYKKSTNPVISSINFGTNGYINKNLANSGFNVNVVTRHLENNQKVNCVLKSGSIENSLTEITINSNSGSTFVSRELILEYPEGNLEVYCDAEDRYDNKADIKYSNQVFKDTQKPTIKLISPDKKIFRRTTPLKFEIKDDHELSNYSYTDNFKPNFDKSSSGSLSGSSKNFELVPQSKYDRSKNRNLVLTITDSAGNTASLSSEFRVKSYRACVIDSQGFWGGVWFWVKDSSCN